MAPPLRSKVRTRAKLVVAALVLAGIALFVVAWQVASNGGSDDISVTRSEGLISIRPARGSEVLKQAEVGVTLEPGWRLVSMRLFASPSLDSGTNVTGFVREIEGLNDFVYNPNEGLPWEEHSADDNCVVVEYERISQPGSIADLDWCFTAS